MFQALTSLSDHDIELVIAAVTEWCSQHHCDIESSRGQLALTTAIDALQSSPGRDALLHHLSEKLDKQS
ncbi:hypothetical protein [Rhizobium leguminosarum]|uniref:hypothetical protein n=1 Tax=Rhizobium leguminosarum TaxID=384 RepID=UPI001C91C99E|nr:hypothetical protein [Rhizobium leguminosarum]MBY2925589.1 hypothetical protein [Rhizobium leguminosarum]MBY2936177.1 hypothetical protein [Rhizobium leguminosarum]